MVAVGSHMGSVGSHMVAVGSHMGSVGSHMVADEDQASVHGDLGLEADGHLGDEHVGSAGGKEGAYAGLVQAVESADGARRNTVGGETQQGAVYVEKCSFYHFFLICANCHAFHTFWKML